MCQLRLELKHLREPNLCFFPIFSHNFDNQLSSIFHSFGLCLCLDTPSEKTGHWQLPNVSSEFLIALLVVLFELTLFNSFFTLSFSHILLCGWHHAPFWGIHASVLCFTKLDNCQYWSAWISFSLFNMSTEVIQKITKKYHIYHTVYYCFKHRGESHYKRKSLKLGYKFKGMLKWCNVYLLVTPGVIDSMSFWKQYPKH